MSDSLRFHVRQAIPADRYRIGALWRELMALHTALDARFRITPDGEQKYIRHVQDLIRSRDARVLVAEEAGQGALVGYMVGELQTRPPIAMAGQYGFISDACVSEGWRRAGVGRALFEEMRRWLVSRKAASIELYIAEANPNAAAFWEAMGFDPFLKLLHLDL